MDKKFVISGRERTADLKTALFEDRGARAHGEKDLAPVKANVFCGVTYSCMALSIMD